MRYAILLPLILLTGLATRLSGQVIENAESFYKTGEYNDWLVKDGHLYLATDVGIYVFDENCQNLMAHWTVTSAGLPSDRVESLALHPETQSIFIGTYDIGAAFQTEAGEWETLPYPEALLQPFNQIRTHVVEFDAQARLLIGSNQGLWRTDGGEDWERFSNTYFDGWIHGVWDMERTEEGEVYIGGNVVAKTEGDEFVIISPTEDPVDLFSYSDTDLYLHSDGSLWAFTDIGVAGHYQDGEWEIRTPFGDDPILMLESRGFVFEHEGALWKYTRNGFYFRHDENGWAAYTEALPFDFSEPELILPFGEQWLGTRAGELYALTDDSPEVLHDLSNWPWSSDELWIFNYDREDQLWVRTGPQALLNLTTEEAYDLSVLGEDFYSYEYFFGADGVLWTFGPDYTLWQLRNGVLENVYSSENTVFAPETYFRDFVLSEDGTPWLINGDEQLYTLQNGSWQEVVDFPVTDYILDLQAGAGSSCYVTRLANSQIDFLAITLEDTQYHSLPLGWTGTYFRNFPGEAPGSLWTFNEQTAQLGYFLAEEWSFLDFPSEWIAEDRPHHLLERAGRLWISGSYQMAFYDGTDWTYYDLDDRYWSNTRISEAGLDKNGEIWMSHNGVQVISHLTTNWGVTSTTSPLDIQISALEVWPNPAITNVQGAWAPGDYLQVLDVEGRILQSTLIVTEEQSLSIARLPVGTYQLMLTTKDGIKVGRLVKAGE